jgi:outer membrane lipoprotein-sorting protein
MGQTKLTAEQQKQIVEKIDKASSAMKTMQCDFTQTKRMKMLSKDMQSKGVMYFKRPDKLRWQYTSPYDYTFIMNGDKVQIKSMKSTKNIDVQQNKMFRQITSIILNSITGGGLKSAADFTVEVYKDNQTYFARLYPKKKELKQVYEVIEIYFNESLTMVSGVKMKEKTGDVTTVKLNNVKINPAINDSTFSID